MAIPKLIEGALAVDDRGELGFVNDFDFDGVKRFYSVSNHRSGFIRAWHAHKREAKYVTVVRGTALIGAVKVDNWDNPSKDSKVWRYTLSENKPSVLYIPIGYANGFMSLTKKTKLMFFSTSTLEDSRGDDLRYDAYYWNAWDVIQR